MASAFDLARRCAPVLALAVLGWARVAAAESAIRARVLWSGDCEDPPALARELQARGVNWIAPPPSEAAVSLAVTVASAERALRAGLELTDASGAQQLREVEVRRCSELRAVAAWMLVVLAKEGRIPNEVPPEAATAAFPSDDEAPRPAAVQGEAAPQQSSPPKKTTATPPPRTVIEAHAPSAATSRPVSVANGGQVGLGSSLISGLGFSARPALGPSLFLQHEFASRWSPMLRLTAFELSSLPFTRAGATVSVQRLAAALSGRVNLGWRPLSAGLDVEAGRLVGSGSGFQGHASDTAVWFAFGASAALEIPLIARLLSLELGAGGSYTPFTYQFQYSDGEHVARSNRGEFRLTLGLVAKP